MKKYSFLLILAAGSLWGTMGVFVDLLTSLGFSTMNAALLRICSAAVMYVIFLLVKDKKLLVIHNAKGISPSAEGDEGYSPSSSPAFLPLFFRRKAGQKNLIFVFPSEFARLIYAVQMGLLSRWIKLVIFICLPASIAAALCRRT